MARAPIRVIAIGLALVALFVHQPVGRAAEADVALVLAVDISNSMDPDEQELQRQGFVEAFRSPMVHNAIGSGMLGRIAVTYMEWAASTTHHIVVPWKEIGGADDALAFADLLARAPIQRGPRTSISGAIDFGVELLGQREDEATRQVIDISGDGANNQGRPVTQARAEALAKGITINGLPLMLKRPSTPWEVENLDEYYRDCVIGGPGAFMIPVRERSQLAEAIKTKISREIAGYENEASIIPAQARSPGGCVESDWGRWPY